MATALARLSARRAVVVTAHRPYTAGRCDRIAVMDAGRVVQLGTPAELSATGGPYRRLWTTVAGA